MNRFFISVSLTQRSGIFCFCFCFWFSLVILLCVSFFFFSYFADVFNSSMWTDLQAAVPQDDDVLSSLANSLPDVALAGRAPSTSSKYSTTGQRPPLESAVHSIAWIHQLGGEPSPTEHPLVKSILVGAQRLLAHRTAKKTPITVSQLEQLVTRKTDAMASLYNIRSVVICLLAFAAFLRFGELAS